MIITIVFLLILLGLSAWIILRLLKRNKELVSLSISHTIIMEKAEAELNNLRAQIDQLMEESAIRKSRQKKSIN